MKLSAAVPADTPVPTYKDIRDLLTMLIGRDVEVKPTDPVTIADGRGYYIATYTTDEGRIGAILVADLSASGFLGGALGLLPAAAIKDAISEKSLPAPAVDNLYEILNVAASMFNMERAPHLKLATLFEPADSVPMEVAASIPVLGRRLDVLVDVPGYGAGRLGMVVPF